MVRLVAGVASVVIPPGAAAALAVERAAEHFWNRRAAVGLDASALRALTARRVASSAAQERGSS
jgi:hypothetical protein